MNEVPKICSDFDVSFIFVKLVEYTQAVRDSTTHEVCSVIHHHPVADIACVEDDCTF